MGETGKYPLGPPLNPPTAFSSRAEPFRPVWVDVMALFPPPEKPLPLVVDGLDLSREAAGVVHFWMRAGHGLWIGCCSYQVPYVDGRDQPKQFERQMVPATALRPRPI